MSSVISIHIGQAGVQIGDSCWELYCLEHGLQPDGRLSEAQDIPVNNNLNTCFQETSSGKYVPRTLFVDSEPNVIDEIKSGRYKELFNPNTLIKGKEDAANNFARAYFSTGFEILETTLESLRNLTEHTDTVNGFFLFHSFGGGTGSGFTSLLLEKMADSFGKTSKFEFAVYPSPRLSTAIVEPYNSVLTTNVGLEFSDCAFIVDNEAIYNILSKINVGRPTYLNLNRLVAQVVSSLTTSLRFTGPLNVDLVEILTNIIPFPRIHFPMVSYAPIMSTEKSYFEQSSIREITKECFSPNNQMTTCDLSSGKYMGCCLFYRGDVAPADIVSSLNHIKMNSTIKFTDWCPTGFKVGINGQAPSFIPEGDLVRTQRAVSLVANSTSIKNAWSNLNYKFNLMFAKRAFIHWYLSEGMEESEFIEANDNLTCLEIDYDELGKDEDYEEHNEY